MSSPPRAQGRRSSSVVRDGHHNVRRTSSSGSGIPMLNTALRASRIAATQPAYDFLTGGVASTPVKPLGQTSRQSTVVKPDIGNEDLRAQIKTLQYELESFKHEREATRLRHDKEVRDAHLKAEEAFQKARMEDSKKYVPIQKYDSLNREYKDAQDQAINQKHTLEKKLRAAQDECRSAKEEAEEVQTELSSMDRQHKHQIQEIESQHRTLQKTMSELRKDLDSKTLLLKTAQDKLSQHDVMTGQLESEILRLKAQTGDSETLIVIKRELSEQVAHIRKLEAVNRDQMAELKNFRKTHKAVDVVQEEKHVLESKLSILADTQKQLREAQLQRQILEDERRSWTSYLESEEGGGAVEYTSPEEMARALVRQRLENAAIVDQMGTLRSEGLEKDELMKQLEAERLALRSSLEQLKGAPTSRAVSSSSSAPSDSRARQRLETQLNFAKKEVLLMREQVRSFDAEEDTYTDNKFDVVKTQRITDLEKMLDDQRRELANLSSELTMLENKTASVESSPLKRSRAEMEQGESELIGQLSRKNRNMQNTITTLSSNLSVSQSEHAALKSQVAALQESAKTRVLCLRANPTSDFEAYKLSTITTLRAENKDLLATLRSRPLGSSSTGDESNSKGSNDLANLIPKSSLDAAQLELQEKSQQIAHAEKRILRLKQIWASKSLEFREAVFSLLGWKMDFRPDGKFALSLNTKKRRTGGSGDDTAGDEETEDEEEESLIFDGERGTMKVSGGNDSAFAREVRPYYQEWVERKRGFIPGLMASVLLSKVQDETLAF